MMENVAGKLTLRRGPRLQVSESTPNRCSVRMAGADQVGW